MNLFLQKTYRKKLIDDRSLTDTLSFQLKGRVERYIRIFFSTITEAILLCAVVYLLCVGLLYLSYIMWTIYQQTIVGQNFLIIFPEKALAINEVMNQNYWVFSKDMTLTAFLVSIGISAACWFLHIGPYFYLSLGFFSKLFFWGTTMTIMVAYIICRTLGFSSLELIVIVCAIPTMAMFMSCFSYTERLTPDLMKVLMITKKLVYRQSPRKS